MASEQIKQLKVAMGADVNLSLASKIAGLSENEAHEYLDRELDALFEAENDYYTNEVPKIRAGIKSLIQSFSEHERHEIRRTYLLGRIEELKPLYLKTGDENIGKLLRKYWHEARIFLGKSKGIEPQDIARAREYPIMEFIKSVHGMAICPFHSDKSPSLNIKNNFYFCHGCGAHGDVIDFVMKTELITFSDAIVRLARHYHLGMMK